MDIEPHLQLRSFEKIAATPILKSLLIALFIHIVFLTVWQHQEETSVAEIPQWINITLTSGVENNDIKPGAVAVVEKDKLKKKIITKKINKSVPAEQVKTEQKIKKEHNHSARTAIAGSASTLIKADSRPFARINPKPVYPAAARRRGMQGTVQLRVEINNRGYVDNISILKSSGYNSLDREALKGVKQWQFIPAKKGQENIDSVVELPVTFTLQQ